MAITQTGAVQRFVPGNANAGTVSSTITVPVDAEFVIATWSGFSTTANFFSTGSMTFTKGGVDTAMTAVSGADSNTSLWQAAMFYLALPDTGASKTLKWDWVGVGTASDPATLCTVTFWKGMDTSSPVRGTGGAQASGAPWTTGTITALSGDLIVAWVGAFCSAEGTVNSWSNLSLLAQVAFNGTNADGALATGSPTGDVAVAGSTATNLADGGILAISLKPASATFQWYPMDFLSFFAELPIIRPILDIVGY